MEASETIRRAQAGDCQAFNRLVQPLQDEAYDLAYRVLCNPEAATAAVESAIALAFAELRRYPGGPFRLWLLHQVARACRSQWQQLQDQGTEDDLRLEDGERRLRRCLKGLPFELRMVLVMVDLAGMEYRQASGVLDLPVKTVQSRLAQARRQALAYL